MTYILLPSILPTLFDDLHSISSYRQVQIDYCSPPSNHSYHLPPYRVPPPTRLEITNNPHLNASNTDIGWLSIVGIETKMSVLAK